MPCQIYSISIYRGKSPLELHPISSEDSPVLTAQNVSDIPAEFVADPFMVQAHGMWHMFFEVMHARTSRGSIGLATSPDGLAWTYRQIVLDETFHLSYPYVFESGGEYYMIPETQRNSSVRLYRADPFPTRWRFIGELLALPLADPSLIEWEGRWWIFGSQYNRKLRLFHSQTLEGPWTEHERSPVLASETADGIRPGGRLTPWNGGFLRYAQDCEAAYGTRVRASLVTALAPGRYEEDESSVIVEPGPAEWRRGGMHHIDPHRLEDGAWLACVDGWYWLS